MIMAHRHGWNSTRERARDINFFCRVQPECIIVERSRWRDRFSRRRQMALAWENLSRTICQCADLRCSIVVPSLSLSLSLSLSILAIQLKTKGPGRVHRHRLLIKKVRYCRVAGIVGTDQIEGSGIPAGQQRVKAALFLALAPSRRVGFSEAKSLAASAPNPPPLPTLIQLRTSLFLSIQK